MNEMIALALSAMMALSPAACGSYGKTGGTEIPDSFTECKTMDEAGRQAGVDMDAPVSIGGKGKTAVHILAETMSDWGTAANGNGVGLPNPFTEFQSMEDAAKAAGFSMLVPDSAEGYPDRVIRVLSGDESKSMIEVIYYNDGAEKEFRIRKAAGSEDISGDYTEYAESNTVAVGEIQVTMKGENGQVQLATWTNNGYTYSIGAYPEVGVSSDMMAGLAAAVQ